MARILIAEDDPSLRKFLAKALTKSGHEVRDVGNGVEALSQLGQEEADLLLADVVMPGLDGIELARRAGRRYPDLKVMFITGFAAVALTARQEGLPTAKILSKPFHLRQLANEVEAMLATPASV
ncbi:response regulator [Rhodovibrionaceae bacterium A322]